MLSNTKARIRTYWTDPDHRTLLIGPVDPNRLMIWQAVADVAFPGFQHLGYLGCLVTR